jgi:hypothetical protein
MENIEVMKMLFEIHHHQLEERRHRIHGITQRVVSVLLVITGWQIVSQAVLSSFLEWLVIFGIVAITATTCYVLYNHNRTYLEIARVISRLNNAFGFFESSKYIAGEAVYEKCFEKFGQQDWWVNIWHHMLIVVIMAAVAVCAVLAH